MTSLVAQNNGLIIRGGSLAAGQSCCCQGQGGCYRCKMGSSWDCEFSTKEECEDCVRESSCFELRQTKCDGTCPDGFSSPSPLTVKVDVSNKWCFSNVSPAEGEATVGCGGILSVKLTGAGAGFAIYGRSAPTLTASVVSNGVTLGISSNECGAGAAGKVEVSGGAIVSASVTDGGSGYAKISYSQPTLTLTPPGGSGGKLSVASYSSPYFGYWSISSVSVDAGGTGYTNNATVSVNLGTGDQLISQALVRIQTAIDPPQDSWALAPDGSSPQTVVGTGLSVSLQLQKVEDSGFVWWEATGATVVSGGSGYNAGDVLNASGSTTAFPALLEVASVGGGGAATGLSVQYGGEHDGIDTGVINKAVVSAGGIFRKRVGQACSTEVSIIQPEGASGAGAQISAKVNTDPDSPSFGKVTSLVVNSGGSGYVLGSGAQLQVSLSKYQDPTCGFDIWAVSSITATSPGSGYSQSDQVTISASSEDTFLWPAKASLSLGDAGEIIGVSVVDGGLYYGKVDKAAAPYVATPTVLIGSGDQPGTGGVISTTIDTDTSSPTFGRVTAMTVTSAGSGYASLCVGTRTVSDCADCPPRQAPESSTCSLISQTGACGQWQFTNDCTDIEPPCCETCLYPRPGLPVPCVPTLNVSDNTGGYEKSSSIPQSGPSGLDPSVWNEEWLQQHTGCTLVWVLDTVAQTGASNLTGPSTGTYCADAVQLGASPGPGGQFPDGYVPPEGCYTVGPFWLYCRTYTLRTFFKWRLFVVDCKTRTMSDVTSEALNEPIEYSACLIPSEYRCDGGLCGYYPLCGPPEDVCKGANPGFLNANPTLECPP